MPEPDKKSLNYHIEEFLDYYCNLPHPPNYAVLLKGDWGTGKSWFINQYREKQKKQKFLYVSLYGLTSFSEIEDDFLSLQFLSLCNYLTNWKFLNQHTQTQILDFYHASGYLGIVTGVLYPNQPAEQKEWLKQSCHDLKHEEGTAEKLHAQILELMEQKDLSKSQKENLQSSITYYNNHQHQMNYAQLRQKNYPIGSGVTEAACKTLIKQRLCCSGMR